MFATQVHFLKITFLEFKLSLASEFVYRWRVLMWVISDAVQPVIFAILWSAVVTSNESGITPAYMISYYFMSAIVAKLTEDWSIQFVSNSIIDGDFAKYVIRPFNYLAEMLGISLAIRTLRLVMLVPFILVGFLVIGDELKYDLESARVFLAILAIFVGFIINFLLGNIFGLAAFFIKQIVGLRALYTNVTMILSGQYVPFVVLPVGIFFLLELLPFRYILSFPIEIVLNDLYPNQIRSGFVIAITWIFLLFALYQLLLKFALTKYESEGI